MSSPKEVDNVNQEEEEEVDSKSVTGSSRSESYSFSRSPESSYSSEWSGEDGEEKEGSSTTKRQRIPLPSPSSCSESPDERIILSSEDEDEDDADDLKPAVHSSVLSTAINEIVDMLVEEETFSTTKEVGRQLRWEELDILGVLQDIPPEYQIVENPGTDIFGQPLSKKPNFECECPKCKRTLAAARFAPHLEKCMGLGRNSSRIASKRLATSSSSHEGHHKSSSSTAGANNGAELGSDEDHFSAEEDDEEWTMERKRKNRKTEKPSPKRHKHKKVLGRNKGARKARGLGLCPLPTETFPVPSSSLSSIDPQIKIEQDFANT